MEARALSAANRMQIRDKVSVRETGHVLQIVAAPDAAPLSSVQGKQLARSCGVSHPHRIEAGGCYGWYGSTVLGELVCVATRAVTR